MFHFFGAKEGHVQTIVARLTANDPTLQEVKCGQLNLDSGLSRDIFIALQHSTHVKKLEFLGNNSSGVIQFLAESIRTHQSLKEIYLGTNNLNDTDVAYLCESLKADTSSVELLDINTNAGITDIGAHHIAELLGKSTHIKNMEIAFTNITDEGLQEIFDALQNNPGSSLVELCDSDILSYGMLTKNEALIQVFSDFFIAKQQSASANPI